MGGDSFYGRELAGAAIGAVAAGAAVAMRSTQWRLGACIGAAAGTALVAAWRRQREEEPWWHDEARVRTFADVAADDAAFREVANRAIVDPGAEADALCRLFDGASATNLTAAALALNNEELLDRSRARWQGWSQRPRADLGAAVLAVVDELEAPHLLPSGIEKRLYDGVNASIFGLFTLMRHAALDDPTAK